MVKFYCRSIQCLFRKGSTTVLAFFWLLGLCSGTMLFRSTQNAVFPLMRGCIYASVSIVSLLFTCIFPFLLSALAVFLSLPWLLLPISFGKAMVTSFLSVGLVHAWGEAAWLIRLCVMLCDLCYIPFLYLFWQRHISGERKCSFAECFVMLALGILIVSMEYCLVIPFFAEVLIL